MGFSTLTAKFPGTCRRCKEPFGEGTRIRYGGRGLTYHLKAECVGVSEAEAGTSAPRVASGEELASAADAAKAAAGLAAGGASADEIMQALLGEAATGEEAADAIPFDQGGARIVRQRWVQSLRSIQTCARCLAELCHGETAFYRAYTVEGEFFSEYTCLNCSNPATAGRWAA